MSGGGGKNLLFVTTQTLENPDGLGLCFQSPYLELDNFKTH